MADALDSITTSDLSAYGLPSDVVTALPAGTATAALASATDEARGYLERVVTPPITAIGSRVKSAVCHIAAWEVSVLHGHRGDGADAVLLKRSEDARSWLSDVAAGKTAAPGLVGTVDEGETDEAGAVVDGDEHRGWSSSVVY